MPRLRVNLILYYGLAPLRGPHCNLLRRGYPDNADFPSESKAGQKALVLPAPAVEILSGLEREDGSPFVFPADEVEGYFQGTQKIWEKVRKKAGLSDVRLHDLRHSFASAALATGAALPVIGKLLGHGSVQTTARYAHPADDPVRRAADRTASGIARALEGKAKAPVIKLRSARGRARR